MNLPRWLYKRDLFQLTSKVNLIKRLLEQLVKQEPLKSFYLRMIWRVMANKNRMDRISCLKPWTKCNWTHNQWTKFRCNKARKNQCSKAKKNSLRKQKVEILQKHGRNVKKNLENCKKWLEIIVNQEKRTQKYKMKKRSRQNLSLKPIQILTISTQKFMQRNSMARNWSMNNIKNKRPKSPSGKNCRNRRRKKKKTNPMMITKMKKNLMKLKMRVRKQFKQKLAWRLGQLWNRRRHCLLQGQAKRHW